MLRHLHTPFFLDDRDAIAMIQTPQISGIIKVSHVTEKHLSKWTNLVATTSRIRIFTLHLS